MAALALAGAIQHAEDIYAMANSVDTDGTVVPGEVRVALEHFGVLTGTQLPFTSEQSSDPGPLTCTRDTRLQRRMCASRQPSESLFAAVATTHHSAHGEAQFTYGPTTDTVVKQVAIVRRGTDRSGHLTDLTLRSTLQYDGVSHASASMTVSGADTTYSTVHRTSGVNRFTGIVRYSDVRLARHPSSFARSYPTSGVVHATAINEWVTPASTRPFYSSVIVYFDGSRTPDAYLDGKRYHLDLDTGLARPYKAE